MADSNVSSDVVTLRHQSPEIFVLRTAWIDACHTQGKLVNGGRFILPPPSAETVVKPDDTQLPGTQNVQRLSILRSNAFPQLTNVPRSVSVVNQPVLK